MNNREVVDGLRARIRAIERRQTVFAGRLVCLGDASIDAALPSGGLAMAGLHELAGEAASGFAAGLAGRALMRGGVLVWCATRAGLARRGALYGAGLLPFGIAPERLLVLRVPDRMHLLWAMEEVLRCPAVACMVGEIDRLGLDQSRRLQLAAEEGGGIGLLLRDTRSRPGADAEPLATFTRWRVEPLWRDGEVFWSADLWRAKGGAPGSWVVRWDERTLSFHGPATLADRADAPARPPLRAALPR